MRNEYQALYKTPAWRKLRKAHLIKHPLCAWCKASGRYVVANTVHHKEAHRGDWLLFINPNNLESLCGPCHNRDGQRQDIEGYDRTIAVDGWPADKNHKFYKV